MHRLEDVQPQLIQSNALADHRSLISNPEVWEADKACARQPARASTIRGCLCGNLSLWAMLALRQYKFS